MRSLAILPRAQNRYTRVSKRYSTTKRWCSHPLSFTESITEMMYSQWWIHQWTSHFTEIVGLYGRPSLSVEDEESDISNSSGISNRYIGVIQNSLAVSEERNENQDEDRNQDHDRGHDDMSEDEDMYRSDSRNDEILVEDEDEDEDENVDRYPGRPVDAIGSGMHIAVDSSNQNETGIVRRLSNIENILSQSQRMGSGLLSVPQRGHREVRSKQQLKQRLLRLFHKHRVPLLGFKMHNAPCGFQVDFKSECSRYFVPWRDALRWFRCGRRAAHIEHLDSLEVTNTPNVVDGIDPHLYAIRHWISTAGSYAYNKAIDRVCFWKALNHYVKK